MQGLLLPLCAGGDCTLREAVILTSAIRRTSIPGLHSAAALMRLADMPYSGTTSFFIRVLLDKKYSLPYRVVGPCHCHCQCQCHQEFCSGGCQITITSLVPSECLCVSISLLIEPHRGGHAACQM